MVIDDGSGHEFSQIFEQIGGLPRVTVLKHPENLGKGVALKTGLYWATSTKGNDWNVSTADSDGQHAVSDIVLVSEVARNNPDAMTLGSRDWEVANVPWKSALGNRVTSKLFAILNGKYITDTQTGLRSFSLSLAEEFAEVGGERYEWETNQLIYCVSNAIEIVECPVQTIYLDKGNSVSHFRPIHDSIKIYGVLFANFIRFASSSILSAVLDYLVFVFLLWLLFGGEALPPEAAFAVVGARLASAVLNFKLNQVLVFRSTNKTQVKASQYAVLALIVMTCSATLTWAFMILLGGHAVLAKLAADAILFLASYLFQKHIIFKPSMQTGRS